MARFHIVVEGAGRPLNAATVTVYTEDATIAVGQETNFVDGDKATLYSDAAMTTEVSNPVTTDIEGSSLVFMPALDQVALKIDKSGYGTKWERFVDVTGTDI